MEGFGGIAGRLHSPDPLRFGALSLAGRSLAAGGGLVAIATGLEKAVGLQSQALSCKLRPFKVTGGTPGPFVPCHFPWGRSYGWAVSPKSSHLPHLGPGTNWEATGVFLENLFSTLEIGTGYFRVSSEAARGVGDISVAISPPNSGAETLF